MRCISLESAPVKSSTDTSASSSALPFTDDWGSVSASLASLDSTSNPTLQDVTDNGAITTDTIQVGTIAVTSMNTGTDNSVVVKKADGELVTDEIDSRVWGST